MQIKTLAPGVYNIPAFLNQEDCKKLVELAEQSGFQAAEVRLANGQKSMPAIRNNERTLIESPGWVDALWKELSGVGLPAIRAACAVGLPKDLRFYKYGPGQRFKMHKDGPWQERGLTSQLTFLVYLNQEFSGGATDFRAFQVEPETGMALIFVHDTWHEGVEVTAGTKYVLRSDILYST